MGSLEENDLVRMVQDFIESESPSPPSSVSSNFHALNHRTRFFILQVLFRCLPSFFLVFVWLISDMLVFVILGHSEESDSCRD